MKLCWDLVLPISAHCTDTLFNNKEVYSNEIRWDFAISTQGDESSCIPKMLITKFNRLW